MKMKYSTECSSSELSTKHQQKCTKWESKAEVKREKKTQATKTKNNRNTKSVDSQI